MSRCAHVKDYTGVELRCTLPAGHEQVESGWPASHTVACNTCAGMVPDAIPEPGVRCSKHGTLEPNA